MYDTYQTAKSVASGQTSLEDLAKNKAGDMLARKAVPGGSIVGKVIDRFKKTPVAEGVERANKEIAQQSVKKAKSEVSEGDLVAKAEKIRKAGTHPASRNQRTVAVGENSEGELFAGSSNGFDKGQRAAAEELGVKCVSCKKGQHAEENLLREVPDLKRVGTSSRAPCGAGEHNCRGQLLEKGVEIDNDSL